MKQQKVILSDCVPGDILAQDVIDVRSGVVLCQADFVLTGETIEWLRKFTCSDIYIKKNTWDQVWNLSEDNVRQYDENKQKLNTILSDISGGKELNESIVENIRRSFFEEFKQNSTIMGCVNIVKTLDEYTYAHCLNVGMLSVLIGKWLKLSEEEVSDLYLAGVLHDIGKYRIDPHIINKKGKLTEKEYVAVKKHVIEGYKLIQDNPFISDRVKEGVLGHHERMDGTGYPRELEGEEISLYGRIVAIADVYDAMISERVYKSKQTPFEVMEKMLSESIDKLDTKILLTFLKNISEYYIGVYVTLSTGQIGEVVFMHPHCIYKPIVKVDDTYLDLDTKPDIRIIDML